MQVKLLEPDEWKLLAEQAHLICFNETRKPDMNRISYALVSELYGLPQAYITVRELDAESVYWQHGGAFPSSSKSPRLVQSYLSAIGFLKEKGVKRIIHYVENVNKPMLKLAITVGFIPTGIRYFKNQIFVEFLFEI